MDNELIKLALGEIAEGMGDSYENPVSLALILGQIGATSRTFKNILIQTRINLINDPDSKDAGTGTNTIDDVAKVLSEMLERENTFKRVIPMRQGETNIKSALDAFK